MQQAITGASCADAGQCRRRATVIDVPCRLANIIPTDISTDRDSRVGDNVLNGDSLRDGIALAVEAGFLVGVRNCDVGLWTC